ncbi:hypothetical protein SAMN04488543_1922 [Friedmanniella luteola]|uniref:Uncharacterized protein n=2 Tax=Friedmanniella luteola TaxID=546871 RepID=A0A1H1T0M7_9ACTN|nr:hypothetical protein SAMN04488543_1922 [Friedmanniella luteola]
MVLLWAAACVQACQALYFWVMGLGWGGVLYTANVVQGAALLVTAIALAARRRLLVLLVPVLSLLLSLGLQQVDALLTARACSPDAKAAVAELGLGYLVDDGDPFTYMLAFPTGCAALFSASDPVPVVLQHYGEAARQAGWDVVADPSSSRVEMSNARWTVEVEPAHEDGLISLLVHPRA